MAYSETKIIIGGIAHVPILIFIVNLIKGKFASKAAELKVDEVKDEVKNEGTKITLTEPKKEKIIPKDDNESEVKDEVIEVEGETENEKKSEVEDQKEEKEVS